ncbi:hypothetical protein INH39_32680 [Massilia violaceinigra]|uniref:Uncharacterized protein n=1 Tax=Massilia violaceinigra TaxID=2045208 RepID=A0ABY4A5I0_9BURK|nr:hypothetical protein [Massilia violaceinigra]UOD30051.1 hypothetical protein INH39_32680 [Massilia violaceinigra]
MIRVRASARAVHFELDADGARTLLGHVLHLRQHGHCEFTARDALEGGSIAISLARSDSDRLALRKKALDFLLDDDSIGLAEFKLAEFIAQGCCATPEFIECAPQTSQKPGRKVRTISTYFVAAPTQN